MNVLIERGYVGATVDAVAAAAHTGKAAIYRRWAGKDALLIAAARSLQVEPTVPDTGTLRGDLLIWAQHYTMSDSRAGLVLAILLGEARHNTELQQAAFEAIGRPPTKVFTAVLDRWISRGVVPASAPLDLVSAVLPAIAFRNVTLRHPALDIATVTRLIDEIMVPALGPRSIDVPGQPI